MELDLLEYKKELYFDIDIGSEYEGVFAEESFFELVSVQLQEAGIVDDVEVCAYRDTKRGIKLDGYSWNALEHSVCGIVTHLSEDANQNFTLSRADALKIANRARRFFEQAARPTFLAQLDQSHPAHQFASFLSGADAEVLKFRIILVTDYVLSNRVKSVALEPILDVSTNVDIWDLNRLRGLSLSESQSEPFQVGPELLGEGGLPLMKGADLPNGATAYLGVMPGKTLSDIYDEFGQRLLEGNVRTFLDFRGGVNKNLRKTLAVEPENFFAYNNGITLTADSAETTKVGELVYVRSLKNLQIVNGGQTTAALYFAPKEAGGVKTPEGEIPYRSIDLSDVAVQMKLTVFNESGQESIDEYRAYISEYANSQNSIQKSDLVSNHPIHLSIERLSRQVPMPTSQTGLSSKWFYERTRGQYSTKIRALSGAAAAKFKLEFPKAQLFTKTDMAKYVNTWRMRPNIVKKGAEANLKELGAELVKEYEADPRMFEAGFYRALISYAILFRGIDKAILAADWYQQERGLKAEAVTFGIALFRHALISERKDINLERIFSQQEVSEPLTRAIVDTAKLVRDAISDSGFRGGTGNPSEFCKSEVGWRKIRDLKVNLEVVMDLDLVDQEQLAEAEAAKTELNKVSTSVNDYQRVLDLGASYWEALASFNREYYPPTSVQVGIPIRCSQMASGGKLISEKQLKAVAKIISDAEAKGFAFMAN